MAMPDVSTFTSTDLDSASDIVSKSTAMSKTIPAHRSHDPVNNLKRSDPFQFGSRYLLPEDDPFEFNAWDHVEPSSEDLDHFASQLAAQRLAPVSDFDRNRFNGDPAQWWNRFYTNNTSNFFKDRKWLQQEFPILKKVTRKGAGKKLLLEIGAGAGNTCFPIAKGNENEDLMVYACDFSPKAVSLIRESPAYDPKMLRAEVWDVASPDLPLGLEEESVDVVLMIFIFSALHPTQWRQSVRNVWRILKPGGEVCFRDYGRGDLAQVRMKKGRWMEENFYIRGDGTRVCFFDKEELRSIWSGEMFRNKSIQDEDFNETEVDGLFIAERSKDEDATGELTAIGSNLMIGSLEPSTKKPSEACFKIESLGVDRRLLINRQRQLKMYRCWMQGRFRKVDRTKETAAG
ncbi:MAG: hypothetical protein LQ341_003711 [Variospora aurantia]|nr:MAG: hypothetical protein LQ341_003711 [Variospora aurantia]